MSTESNCTLSGTWVVCPKCGNDGRFKRVRTRKVTPSMRCRCLICKSCGQSIRVFEERKG